MSRGLYSARRLADRKLNTGDAMPFLASFSDGSRSRRLKDRGWITQSPRGRKSEMFAQLLLLVLEQFMRMLRTLHREAASRAPSCW